MAKNGSNDEKLIWGPVPAVIPGDPLFGSQWHLRNTSYPGQDLRLGAVWEDYTGRGVVVGIIDTGIDYNHPDLAANYRFDLDYDARDGDNDAFASAADDDHGTAVAGMITGSIDGAGSVGVAPDAQITGFRIGFGVGGEDQILAQMLNAVTVDVVNNSWGYGGYFFDDFASATFSAIGDAIEAAARDGRGGLGTVFTFAAGNSGQVGQNVNYHSFQNSPYTIAVGAVDITGNIASFSTPGAAVLVSAPGVNVFTTDRLGAEGFAAGDYTTLSGTSFSSPATAGVIALMLEANPALGYRDVQEILVYSARENAGSSAGWRTNGADNWNGGGLSVHDSYGFGLVDGHGAVRLAETWTAQSTLANLVTVSASASPGLAIPDNTTITSTISITQDIEIDHVQVVLGITHTWIGDLTVTLTSPGGTTSVLIDRPGVSASDSTGSSQDDINFTVSSVQQWGESSVGTWTLTVTDGFAGDTGSLDSWTLKVLGDLPSEDDVFIYTDEFGDVAGTSASAEAGGAPTAAAGSSAPAANLADLTPGVDYVAGEFIVKLKADVGAEEGASLAASMGATVAGTAVTSGIQLWQFEGSYADAEAALGGSGLVDYIEPNYIVSVDSTHDSPDQTAIPNDPGFNQLWGLNNTGQTGGVIDADIDAPEAWDIQTGGNVIVGVIDTGVDYTHIDLAANMWTNPGEIAGNGIDDDGNGYIDDYYGYDFVNNDGDPYDDHFHGTHVAGTIAGDGNNGTGIAGVTWSSQIMALKFLDANGSGSLFNAVRAIEYATAMGAQITNNSWGGGGYSQSLYNAIAAAGNAGSLFIAAAGNANNNNDVSASYPATYNLDNIISVAATTSSDGRSSFSSYGATTVDLGAPGSSIYSTLPGNSYGTLSGTSMATPHVVGVASLLLAQDPTLSIAEVKAAILGSVDQIAALDGLTVSGGRLNAHQALLSLGDGGGGDGGGGEPSGRTLLSDPGGIDTINAAAVTSDLIIDLTPGATSTIAGKTLVIEAGTVIENVIGGDGDDRLTGNTADNELRGARGDDTINGNGGVDTAVYAGNLADFELTWTGVDAAIVRDLRPDLAGNEGTDTLTDIDFARFADQTVALATLNRPPVAVDDTAATAEDTAVTIAASDLLANDSDPNGDPITLVSVQNPANGSVALNADGDVVFTPGADFNGEASFDYTIADPDGGTHSATVTVTVTPVNDTPAAGDDTVAIDEDTDAVIAPALLLGNDTDPDGDTLTLTGLSGAVNGTVSLDPDGMVRFSPDADFNGAGGFDYTITDGNGANDTGHVTVNVAPVNDAPTQIALAGAPIDENALGAVVGQVTVTDVDDASHNFAVSDSRFEVVGGQLKLKDGVSLDYETEQSVNLQITASDPGGLSVIGNFTVSVIDDTNEPTEGDDILLGTPRGDVIDALGGNDDISGLGGDDVLLGGAGNDILSGGGGNDTLYGGEGDDQYRFARGGARDTVYDDHRVTESYTYYETEQTSVTEEVWVGDGKTGHYETVTRTTTVNVERQGTRVVQGDGGDDALVFGAGITVSHILAEASGNDLVVGLAPEAGGAAIAALPGVSDTITLQDWFNPLNQIETFRFADGGEYDVRAMNFAAGTDGDDTINGAGGADWINGAAGNDIIDGAAGNDILIGGGGNDTITGGAGDDEIIGGSGTNVAVYSGAVADYHVTLTANGATVRDINPGDGDDGTDTLTGIDFLRFSDGQFAPDALPSPPAAGDDAASTTEDTAVTIDVLGNDSDAENDPLSVNSVGAASNGQTAINPDGTITYTPNANFNGTDSFVYTLGDGTGRKDTATVTVSVSPVNDAPTLALGIADQSATEGAAFDFAVPAGAFFDPDAGDTLSYSATLLDGTALPAWLSFDGARFTGTPGNAQLGSIDIQLQAIDGSGLSTDTSFVLTVNEPTRDPTEGDDILVGTPQGDVIDALGGNDDVSGLGGDDVLSGGAGNDILSGGGGNDALYGGEGDDQYRFGRGGARDTAYDDHRVTETYTYYEQQQTTVTEQVWVGDGKTGHFETVTRTTTVNVARQGTRVVQGDGGDDALVFGAGITASHILAEASGNDLVVGLAPEAGGAAIAALPGVSDTITLQDWFNPMNQIETFRFADGNEYDVRATSFAAGTTGDDTINGAGGADWINGAAGNDIIDGAAGNDILIGGGGDDIVLGGLGDDTFVFGRGDGADTIFDDRTYTETYTYYETEQSTVTEQVWIGDGKTGHYETVTRTTTISVAREGTRVVREDGGDDTLEFGPGISVSDILASQSGDDLLIGLKDADDSSALSADSVAIQDWFDPLNQVETFRFVDGGEIDVSGRQFVTGTSGNDTLGGGEAADWINGWQGNDTLTGGGGNDLFVFGRGDGADTITDFSAGAGSDDVMEVSAFGFGSFGELLAAATDNGADLTIQLDTDVSVTLLGVIKADLDENDFLI